MDFSSSNKQVWPQALALSSIANHPSGRDLRTRLSKQFSFCSLFGLSIWLPYLQQISWRCESLYWQDILGLHLGWIPFCDGFDLAVKGSCLGDVQTYDWWHCHILWLVFLDTYSHFCILNSSQSKFFSLMFSKTLVEEGYECKRDNIYWEWYSRPSLGRWKTVA